MPSRRDPEQRTHRAFIPSQSQYRKIWGPQLQVSLGVPYLAGTHVPVPLVMQEFMASCLGLPPLQLPLPLELRAWSVSPLLCFGETPGALQSFGVPNIARTWNCWNRSRGGWEVVKRTGTPSLWRQAERIGTGRVFHPEKEKVV